MALPKKHRFQNKKEFLQVKEGGKLFQTPLFALIISSLDSGKSRFGFVVSKKIDSRAVTRNKIKRKLAESVRLCLGEIKPKQGVIFLAKRNLKGKKTDEIFSVVKKIFSQAGITKKGNI